MNDRELELLQMLTALVTKLSDNLSLVITKLNKLEQKYAALKQKETED
jgi:hypothetical protein